ncbi:MAG: Na+/H+ antiporter NhaA [Phycisphaerales bacterium]
MASSGVPKVADDRPVDVLLRPIHRFLRISALAGVLLLVCAGVALAWANSPWSESYHALWHAPVTIALGSFELTMSLEHFVNDGLMAIFFFVIGLEIKREVLVGELASRERAMGPALAAVGGMIAPGLLYFAITRTFGNAEATRGWAIPTATDIAFAVAIMAMLGNRVPLGLRVFLTALAIVDDLLAVVVIAVFYTSKISVIALVGASVALAASFIANRIGVRSPMVYALLGIVIWLLLLSSGVHATIGGVLLALTIPASIRLDAPRFVTAARSALEQFEASSGRASSILVNPDAQVALRGLEQYSEQAQAPLGRLEHALHPWVAFVIMPIFALANAGVGLGGEFREAIGSGVGLGAAIGLVLGKPIGILLATTIGVRTGVCRLPGGVSRAQLVGASCLAGIGFTMSLFIANLSFETKGMLQLAKVGVLGGSIVSGFVGATILFWAKQSRGPSEASAADGG